MSRPRKPAYAAIAEELKQAKAEVHVLSRSLNAFLDSVQAGQMIKVSGRAGYRAWIISPLGADGGYVVVQWAPRGGQRPYSSAHYIDEWTDREGRAVEHLFETKDPVTAAWRELVGAVREAVIKARYQAQEQIPSMVLGQLCSMCQQGTTKAASCEACGGTYCPHMIRDHACKAAKAAGE